MNAIMNDSLYPYLAAVSLMGNGPGPRVIHHAADYGRHNYENAEGLLYRQTRLVRYVEYATDGIQEKAGYS